MKTKASSTELKFCAKCDKAITRTERRYVDSISHTHLSCGDAPTIKQDDIGKLTKLTNDWINN